MSLPKNVQATSEPTIKNIDHVPEVPSPGATVTFYATVYGSDISSVKVSIVECYGDICTPPYYVDMEKISNSYEYKGSTTLDVTTTNVTYIIEVQAGTILKKSDEYEFNTGEVSNNRPFCRIINPKNGDIVSSIYTITGIAGDPDEGDSVEKVEIRIDNGDWIEVSGTTDWSFDLDTTQYANGQHTLYARAYDGEKYSGIEDGTYNSVIFIIQNEEQPSENQAPTISIEYPEDGATVSGIVNISGTASDPDGNVILIRIKIGNENWVSANGTSTWFYIWDTRNYSNGAYEIKAYALDNNGKPSSIASITVTIYNPINKPPEISIVSPENGATVSGIVNISGTASDPDGDNTLERVEIKLGYNNWQPATGTKIWYYVWNTTGIDYEEDFIISARVYDINGSYASKSIYVTINNQQGNQRPTVRITSPENGATITEKTVEIKGIANDPDGTISAVKIWVGGEWKTASGTTIWSYNLDTTNLFGTVKIKAVAYDDKNQPSSEASITLNIQYNGGGNETPGFEIISLLIAIILLPILKIWRKKHEN
jgi:hypothetical protein